MIRRFVIENESYHDHADGPWCLHTDHLAAIAELEGGDAKLRQSLAITNEQMAVMSAENAKLRQQVAVLKYRISESIAAKVGA